MTCETCDNNISDYTGKPYCFIYQTPTMGLSPCDSYVPRESAEKHCKYLSDEFSAICINADCPACADGCPCLNYQEICKYYVEEEQ